ncbi:uncharacterized protein [Lepeophtheirus salmonis]|uniref:Uncharacterized protein n=1 Tax=Lepeophtheirus salmonis TaxID=72036 RepID=A0A0K2UYB4_LEPSM|nr:uncharacterized protein LOC121124561 [Lepeophtheirus salmonis]
MPPNNFLKEQTRRKAPLRKAISCIDPPSLEALNKRKEGSSVRRHSKVEVVSCFRSSGTVTLPKPKVLPPLVKPLQTLTANTESLINFLPEEITELNISSAHSSMSAHGQLSTTPHSANLVGKEGPSIEAKLCELPPPPPPKKNVNYCSKHTKCHCDLFSKDLDSFFGIEIKQKLV